MTTATAEEEQQEKEKEQKLKEMKSELYDYLKNAPDTEKQAEITEYWHQYNVIKQRFRMQCFIELDMHIDDANYHIVAVEQQEQKDQEERDGIKVSRY